MKKFALIFVAVLGGVVSYVVVSWILAGEKITTETFQKDGMTIIADSSFYQKEILSFNIYLESKDKIITGLRESPTEIFPISTDLREYTETVLQVNNLSSAEINTFNEDGVIYEYFIYERENAGKIFKYLGITKKGTAFYLFNFACESKNFDAFQEKFLNWAKQIVVE